MHRFCRDAKGADRRRVRELGQYSLDERFGVREPSFGTGFADASNEGRAEPTLDEVVQSIAAPEIFTIDPRIDCVITLRFDQAISGAEILDEINAWSDTPAKSTARWMCEGLNADVDTAQDWEQLRADASYSELQLAIQLASRRGPIGVLELSDFCSRAQALAETLGSQIDMPSVSTMLESAKELDGMAAESDIQLSINVVFDEASPWANFESLMRQRGFKLARNGRQFEYYSNNKLIFTRQLLRQALQSGSLKRLFLKHMVRNKRSQLTRPLIFAECLPPLTRE